MFRELKAFEAFSLQSLKFSLPVNTERGTYFEFLSVMPRKVSWFQLG